MQTAVSDDANRHRQQPPTPANSRKQRTARAKRQIPGDHQVGYGRPPAEHRFKPGNPGGPGRRKGSRSQDSLLRDELDAKQTVRENGRTVQLSTRQLLNKLLVKRALEKQDPKSLALALGHALRLFPDAPYSNAHETPFSDTALDEAILRQLIEGLSLGDPDPDCPDPWADLINQSLLISDAGGNSSGGNDRDGRKKDAMAVEPDLADEEWGDSDDQE